MKSPIIFFFILKMLFLLWLPDSNVGFLACWGVVVNTSGRLPSSSLLPFTIFLQREFFAIPPQYFKIFYNFPQYLPIAQCSDKKEITFQVKENFFPSYVAAHVFGTSCSRFLVHWDFLNNELGSKFIRTKNLHFDSSGMQKNSWEWLQNSWEWLERGREGWSFPWRLLSSAELSELQLPPTPAFNHIVAGQNFW